LSRPRAGVTLVELSLFVASTVLLAAIVLPVVAQGLAAETDHTFTVAAVQTELRFWTSAADFAAHMGARVQAALEPKPDLIVFPEDIGTPLVTLGDEDLIARVRTLPGAIQALAARHALEVGAQVAEHGVSLQRGLWLTRARAVETAYRETFSALARRYKVPILAGSAPMVVPDEPTGIFNTTCLFDPEGTMHVLGRKIHLVNLEGPEGLDLSPGSLDSYKVFRLPKAVIGCIVCADAWHPEIAGALVDQGAQVLLQVSANPEVWTQDTREGWKNSLFTRVQELKVYGVCAMGVGNLLSLPFQGQSAIVAPTEWTEQGDGFIAEAASPTEQAVVVATLDLSRVAPR